MKIWKRTSTDTITALGKVIIELSNGERFYISEEFEKLIINKQEGSMNITPAYSNQIEIN